MNYVELTRAALYNERMGGHALAAILLFQASESDASKPVFATEGADKVVGSIHFVAKASGVLDISPWIEKTIRLRDIGVMAKVGIGPLRPVEKRIDLGNGFRLSLIDSRAEVEGKPYNGSHFAFCADRTDLETFSWEGFKAEPTGTALKTQESGQVSFVHTMVAEGWEITKTTFDTNVALRVYEKGGSPFIEGSSPSWRVTIRKGSYITWPSLVDGKVVLVGDLKDELGCELGPQQP